MGESIPKFAVDAMLGKLAKWLRMLGYDTLYNPRFSLSKLAKLGSKENRIMLTRNRRLYETAPNICGYIVSSAHFPEQLSEIIKKFSLEKEKYLFTRCTICNEKVFSIDKKEVLDRIPSFVSRTYAEFFLCPVCSRIYWPGSHFKHVREKLQEIT